MTYYPYSRVTKLGEQLRKAKVPKETIAEIMAGSETVSRTDPPLERAAWLRAAMERMEQHLDHDTIVAVREGCACAIGGKRDEMSKAIFTDYATLEERVIAANEAHLVFGQSVELTTEGKILIKWGEDGKGPYFCTCLGKEISEPISLTYCMCCGGHMKYHIQQATGRQVTCEMVTSALSSGQKEYCTFLMTIVD